MNPSRRKASQSLATLALASLFAPDMTQAAARPKNVPAGQQQGRNVVDVDGLPLPAGIRERYVAGVNGLTVHVLEAGFEVAHRPVVLLLHGFPELAYSWRKIMLPLAGAGYHVIAPDMRGYGRTTGWDGSLDGDVASFRTHNLALDALGVVLAMGHSSVQAVVGHDIGSSVAAYCSLVRPDFFRSVVLMGAPFGGVPPVPFDSGVQLLPVAHRQPAPSSDPLAALPRPRKDSTTYFSSRTANAELLNSPQGLHDFMRAYFYVKSGDWKENRPFALHSAAPEELAKQPTYYVMDIDKTMPETVAPDMPSGKEGSGSPWLPDRDLDVYVREFQRTGFQGALNWYRCTTGGINRSDLQLFSGRSIDIPSTFIAGTADWARFRPPGALDKMQGEACTRMIGVCLVDGAGHWVQQEKPDVLVGLLLDFFGTVEQPA